MANTRFIQSMEGWYTII